MEPLKNCPFCGNKAKFMTRSNIIHGQERGFEFGICCSKCEAALPYERYRLDLRLSDLGELELVNDERPTAIKAWNRRAE